MARRGWPCQVTDCFLARTTEDHAYIFYNYPSKLFREWKVCKVHYWLLFATSQSFFGSIILRPVNEERQDVNNLFDICFFFVTSWDPRSTTKQIFSVKEGRGVPPKSAKTFWENDFPLIWSKNANANDAKSSQELLNKDRILITRTWSPLQF